MTELTRPKNVLSNDQIAAMLIRMKTPAMAKSFQLLVSDPRYQDFTLAECVSIMVTSEAESRAAKRGALYLKNSGLMELDVYNQADFSKAIFSAERNLKERDLRLLLSCDWIRDAHNVMIDGPAGTGKTWMLTMLGKQACLDLLRVEYYRFSKFLELLADARKGNQMNSLLEQFRRCSVLMIDDFGLSSVSSDAASDLLTVLTEREGRSSVAIASQLPFVEWHKSLGGGHSADAIMDRLLNTSYKFNLDGRSLRELKPHGMMK